VKRKMEEREQVAMAEVSVMSQQKNQPGEASATTAGEGSRASPAASLPRYQPYPTSGKTKDVRKWFEERDRVNEISSFLCQGYD
jgi:hypothetical protein